MKKVSFLIVLLGTFLISYTQENTEKKEKPVEVKVSGFIMNNIFFDNRKNADALDGMALLFPLPQSVNANGEDLNEIPNITLLSFASRLRFGITGPDAFGAKTSGYMEYDFTARATHNTFTTAGAVQSTSTTASVRFRQAWAKLNWTNTELLVGRAWHPLASTDVVPQVMALSVGAPFQPFNRSEQITVTQKVGNIHIIASALYQNDYTNNGPSGKSYSYQNNALIPNLHLQVKYKTDNIIAGLGVDYKKLKPRTIITTPKTGLKVKTDETLDCPAFLAFAQVKSNKLTVSAKTILASNISESLMTGAFAIATYDTLTGFETYKPFKHYFLWGNINYGGKLKVNLFGGYLKNLGATGNIMAPLNANTPTVFGLGETISEMVRITPTVSVTSGKMVLALEWENNFTWYGSIDYANKGNIINNKKVFGTRVLATMLYNF